MLNEQSLSTLRSIRKPTFGIIYGFFNGINHEILKEKTFHGRTLGYDSKGPAY